MTEYSTTILPDALKKAMFDELGASSPDSLELPTEIVKGIVEFLSEDLFCDHAVNICMCSTIGVVEALNLAMDGKEICESCSEGYVWDQAKYDRFMATNPEYDEPDAGYAKCGVCDGKGVVSQPIR